MQIAEIQALTQKIKENMEKVVVGKSEKIELILAALLAKGHVLLEDVPGTGKTVLAKSLAKSLDTTFKRIQFTPDLMPADVTGTNVIDKDEMGQNTLKFQKGPIFSNVILADEINRATPKTQSALLEAMQEHTVTAGGHTYNLSEPFFVLATQNPIEQDGTYPLPEAQMDRFMFKLVVGFPTKEELYSIVNMTQESMEEHAQAVLTGDELLQMRRAAKDILIIDDVLNYAIKLVSATHPELSDSPETTKKYIRFGASPRAAQALITAGKVKALMEGRYNVSYEDINILAYPVLRHRIKPSFNAITDKVGVDQIITKLIKELSGNKSAPATESNAKKSFLKK